MWLDKLRELRALRGNPPYRKIGEDANLPERTVSRIFLGETPNPYITTLEMIANALDGTLRDIFADTGVVVGNEQMATLQKDLDIVSAENDILVTENTVLKDKVLNLTAEVELLKLKLEHKEEIISIHNYYNQLRK